MTIIKRPKKRVHRSFRLKPELAIKIRKIAHKEKVSQTVVLESLLEHALKAYEEEKGEISGNEEL
jgi:predicted transcriptional regulator